MGYISYKRGVKELKRDSSLFEIRAKSNQLFSHMFHMSLKLRHWVKSLNFFNFLQTDPPLMADARKDLSLMSMQALGKINCLKNNGISNCDLERSRFVGSSLLTKNSSHIISGFFKVCLHSILTHQYSVHENRSQLFILSKSLIPVCLKLIQCLSSGSHY